ncbi:hypothetical protein PLICRDRAFT_41954 [Plicaturopsis crispa FD-325 SS-3]|nr:hypothetical protein PLICRDRAFT_41954 [Plicaturopsis crispa FD-325 SS-3]
MSTSSRRSLSLSRGRNSISRRPPSPPSQTYHPGSILHHTVPTPALVESVAGGAHYSGVKVDREASKHRHMSHERRISRNVATHNHERVMDDLKELYCCRPTRAILERSWNKDAVFEDPLVKCKGFREYSSQWFALPKAFAKSETLARRVLSSTASPNRLVFSQTQEYTLRLFGSRKIVESIILVDLDDDEKIIKLVEKWGGNELPTGFGTHFLRRANAKVVPLIVWVPKHDRRSAH